MSFSPFVSEYYCYNKQTKNSLDTSEPLHYIQLSQKRIKIKHKILTQLLIISSQTKSILFSLRRQTSVTFQFHQLVLLYGLVFFFFLANPSHLICNAPAANWYGSRLRLPGLHDVKLFRKSLENLFLFFNHESIYIFLRH